jgi:hypothetical protein
MAMGAFYIISPRTIHAVDSTGLDFSISLFLTIKTVKIKDDNTGDIFASLDVSK